MKLLEIFLDKISNTTLFEMAMERKLAKSMVVDLSPQIIKHMIKLFVINDPNSMRHWIIEIDGWLHKIQDIQLKPNMKSVDKYTLYQWLIHDSAPHYDSEFVDKTVRRFKQREYSGAVFHQFDSDYVIEKITSILGLVCGDLAKDEFNSIEDYL